MSKDIHGQFGPEVKSGPRATNGGKMEVKPVPYSPPVGPKHQHQQGPGLGGGTNHGCCGTQGKH